MESDQKDAVIACIPFLRNLIEYTIDNHKKDADYLFLTKILHVTDEKDEGNVKGLENIYNRYFKRNFNFTNKDCSVKELIYSVSESICSQDRNYEEFNSKIVLVISIRLLAEEYILKEIRKEYGDIPKDLDLEKNQTGRLIAYYKKKFPQKTKEILLLNKILIVTSENIHLNSFMYEPIIDIPIDNLILLFKKMNQLIISFNHDP